ncbi:hypothetical protein HAX54_037365 [Datura stramonium]|uniref:Uncharacterized protein n=1 Tax=Datura stramonium TaxID=4076 RepID=A0ABS8RMM6_DATST|nr:hypothetical protein [Datura stramonium]
MDNNFMYQHLAEIEEPDESDFYLPDYDGQEEDDSNFIYIINTILSGTARLNILLPTVTILAFTIFAPILTNDMNATILSKLQVSYWETALWGGNFQWHLDF